MRLFNQKVFLRIVAINLISISVVTNSIASTNIKQVSGKELTIVAEKMNTETLKADDLIKNFQGFDSDKAHQLEAFFAANPEYRMIKIPKATVEGDKLSFVIEGKKSLFSLDKLGKMEILVGANNIKLDYTMTFEQMLKKTSEGLNEKHASLLSFLVQEAHAGLLVGAVAIAATGASVYITYGKYLQYNFINYAQMAKRVCAGAPIEGVEGPIELQRKLKEIHDQLFDGWTDICMQSAPAKPGYLPKGADREACKEVTPLRLCIKAKIEKREKEIAAELSTLHKLKPVQTDDTARGNIKDSKPGTDPSNNSDKNPAASAEKK